MAESTTKPKTKTIGVTPRTHSALSKVCKARGWSYGEAVSRLASRELESISAETKTTVASA